MDTFINATLFGIAVFDLIVASYIIIASYGLSEWEKQQRRQREKFQIFWRTKTNETRP